MIGDHAAQRRQDAEDRIARVPMDGRLVVCAEAWTVGVVLNDYSEPIPIDRLSQVTGLPRRSVEAAVQELRLAGVPIVSGDGGVRIAETAAEVEDCVKRLQARAVTQLSTVRALRRTSQRMRVAEAGMTQPALG